MKDLLIIIPAYNEGENIGQLLNSIINKDVCDFADILVIDDKSTDNTTQIVKSYGKCIEMIKHIYNMGYGAALKTGYVYAINNNYDYVIQMDADGQHSVENIYPIYNIIKEPNAPDILLGSRFLVGSESFKMSFIKKCAILFFRFIIKISTGYKITDPTSGLQGLKRRTFSYYGQFMNFDLRFPDANMIIKMLLMGFTIKEIPSIMYERSHGKSIHSGLKPIKYMFLMMLSTITVILQYKFLKVNKDVME